MHDLNIVIFRLNFECTDKHILTNLKKDFLLVMSYLFCKIKYVKEVTAC